jgi:hypothetical protein
METTLMNDSLKIECEWWGPLGDESDVSQACRAAIGIKVGDQHLTRLEDSWAATIRPRMNGNAYTLAQWFAGNWWRLRWEPETPTSQVDVDWRMSHSMGSAGGGFSWPGIIFASDGDSVAIASRASRGKVMGPVRYLSDLSTRITASQFEREIDSFLSFVLSRLHAKGHGDSELAELWQDVMNERNDPALSPFRRMEAICGYDPDEAPDDLMKLLLEDGYDLGKHAVEEVAAHARHRTQEVLNEIKSLSDKKGVPQAGGYRCRPRTLTSPITYRKGARPWEKAALLARTAREEWNLGDAPVSNMHLGDFFRTPKKVFSRSKTAESNPITLGLRGANRDCLDIYLGKKPDTSRRFAASRLLGQWLQMNGETERLVPVADAKTAQQQFQRAFAQEFLCPYKALMERMQTERPTEENIEDTAEHFGVSSLLIKTTLVNNGEQDRDSLNWAA